MQFAQARPERRESAQRGGGRHHVDGLFSSEDELEQSMTWHGPGTPFVQAQPRSKATPVFVGYDNVPGCAGTTPSMWPSFDLVRQTGYAVTSAMADQPDRAVRKPIL